MEPCVHCNSMISEEDPTLLRKAAEYLERWKESDVPSNTGPRYV